MTISILQLSDIHFKTENNSILDKTKKLFDAIKNEIDCSQYLFILFTGDIAFSGQIDEYRQAEIFINQLKNSILEYKNNITIEFIFTPGNHDCAFDENQEIRNMLIDNLIKNPFKITPTLISENVKIQKQYFDFIKKFESDDSLCKEVSDELFTRYIYSIGGYKIAFNSYNLAWISKKQEVQSEIIYPTKRINKNAITNENYNLTISLFHHPLHWLKHDNMRDFKELVNSTSNIVLTGHEHTHGASKESKISSNQYVEYIEAGVLQNSNNQNKSSFNLLNIDFEHNTQTITELIWNVDLYEKNNTQENVQLPFSKKSVFQLKEKYRARINDMELKITHPEKEDIQLEDLYIYPDLVAINNQVKNKNVFLESSSKIFKNINDIKHSIVYGAETSGKTSLIRILQLKYKKDNLIPIILNGNEIKSNDLHKEKIKELVHKAFKNQYEYDKKTLLTFEQLDKSQIILFIDDFQEIRLNQISTIAFIKNLIALNYQHILIFAHESLQVKATTESDLAKVLVSFKHYKLIEFGHKLREKMIRKWVKLGRETAIDHKELLYSTREKANSINTTIGYNIVPSYPIYILTLLQAMEINESNTLKKSNYGHYYHFLIMQNLNAKSPMEPKDINTVFTYTSTLAFECLKNKKYIISHDELLEFDRAYCLDKKFTPSFKIIDKLVKSNILNKVDEEYKFSHNYIYYYFVGQYFSDNISNVDIQEIVKKMCKRLYRIEFANILMFLIHHSPQNFILDTLIDEVKQVFSNLPEFIFSTEELNKINTSVKTASLKLENRSLEKSREIELEEKEKDHKLNQLNEIDDLYDADYNEEIQVLDRFAKINLAFKLIEILGEVIKNYSGSLDGNLKMTLIQETYNVGLRSLKSLVQLFNDEHDLLTELIQDNIVKKGLATEHKANEITAKIIFNVVLSISSDFIQKIAKSVASKDLKEIYAEILENDKDNISIQLLNQAIDLDFEHGLHERKVEELHKQLVENHNSLASSTLKKIVVEHIYMYEYTESKKQSICAKLGIENGTTKMQLMRQLKK